MDKIKAMDKKIPIYNLEITSDFDDDVEVDVVSLVHRPAIERAFLMFKDEFAEGMPHYTKDGILWEGPTHKDADGRLMTGATHTEDSVYLYHIDELAKVEHQIVCENCGHSWNYEEGGDDTYKCHLCNYVNRETFESYSDYPDAVKNNAKAALKYAEENGWGSCGTDVGKQRANQLAKGEPISIETIKRMYSYLSRHEVDLENSKGYGDGCGKLMYDAWGGKSALSWAESKIRQIERQNFAIQDEEERIISGPLMLADTPIYRNDDNGEYYVVFSKETIKKIAQRFFKKGYQSNVNLMHDQGNLTEGMTMFESWIKDDKRGIKAMKGFEDVPDGSWFGSFKVDNDEVWQMVKEGKVRGFSVEGQFNYRKTGDKRIEQLWANVLKVLAQIG